VRANANLGSSEQSKGGYGLQGSAMQIVCELQKIQVGELKTIQVRWDTVGLGVLGKPYVSSNPNLVSSRTTQVGGGGTV